jgi:hypothetical protein
MSEGGLSIGLFRAKIILHHVSNMLELSLIKSIWVFNSISQSLLLLLVLDLPNQRPNPYSNQNNGQQRKDDSQRSPRIDKPDEHESNNPRQSQWLHLHKQSMCQLQTHPFSKGKAFNNLACACQDPYTWSATYLVCACNQYYTQILYING